MSNETQTLVDLKELEEWSPVIEFHEISGSKSGGVYVKELNATEWNAVLFSSIAPTAPKKKRSAKSEEPEMDDKNFQARALAASVCDKDGKCLYALTDYARIGKFKPSIFTELYKHAEDINGWSAEEQDATVKNS